MTEPIRPSHPRWVNPINSIAQSQLFDRFQRMRKAWKRIVASLNNGCSALSHRLFRRRQMSNVSKQHSYEAFKIWISNHLEWIIFIIGSSYEVHNHIYSYTRVLGGLLVRNLPTIYIFLLFRLFSLVSSILLFFVFFWW